jgi:hypothetical protein
VSLPADGSRATSVRSKPVFRRSQAARPRHDLRVIRLDFGAFLDLSGLRRQSGRKGQSDGSGAEDSCPGLESRGLPPLLCAMDAASQTRVIVPAQPAFPMQ